MFIVSCFVCLQENFVPVDDALIEREEPKYHVILALSLTKWIHLNWGDSGIKRMFKRVYASLLPGGMFIMEPQPFSSYEKKKHLTVSLQKCAWVHVCICTIYKWSKGKAIFRSCNACLQGICCVVTAPGYMVYWNCLTRSIPSCWAGFFLQCSMKYSRITPAYRSSQKNLAITCWARRLGLLSVYH